MATDKASASCAVLIAALFGALTPAEAATRLPFQSGFETGDFSEWDGGGDATMSVTSSQAAQGRYSAQSVMTSGVATDNYKDFVFGNHPRVGGQSLNVDAGLWLEFDVKFDPGFTFPDCQCVHKIVIVNLEDGNSLRRYQLIINVWTPNRTYFVEHLKWNVDRSFNRAFPSITQNVGIEATVRIGVWDHLKMYVKPNTPGQADGIVRLWINGALKVDYSNIPIREDTTYLPNKLIMSNYVNVLTTSGTQRWDNFYLGETDRSAAQVTPRAPVLLEVR
jgi:Polysaccharide lyase